MGKGVRKDGPRGQTGLTKITAGVWCSHHQPSRVPNAVHLTSRVARCAPVLQVGEWDGPRFAVDLEPSSERSRDAWLV